jgi:hypothetical protein
MLASTSWSFAPSDSLGGINGGGRSCRLGIRSPRRRNDRYRVGGPRGLDYEAQPEPPYPGWVDLWVPIVLWLLTMSLLCWSVVVADRARRASVRSSWQAGWMVGGIGFLLGFVGPLVVTPTANLGPLLGILLTGPLGFVVGAIGAAVVRAARGSE